MARKSTRSVRVKGATRQEQDIVKAAKQAGREDAANRGNPTAAQTRATVAAALEPQQHTRLAEPGESPSTVEPATDPVIEQEQHTRLATPDDPEAKQQTKELNAARKLRGEPVEVVQNARKLPNAGDTAREARAKQQAQFDKADEAGRAEIIEANRLRGAALGGAA